MNMDGSRCGDVFRPSSHPTDIFLSHWFWMSDVAVSLIVNVVAMIEDLYE